MAQTVSISIAGGATATYGAGGDTPNSALPGYDHHRVRVTTGEVAVSSVDQNGSATPKSVESGVTTESIYDLTNTKLFSFVATGATVLTVTSW